MFRYVAFVWNDRDAAAGEGAGELSRRLLAGSSSWEKVFESAGVAVYCRDIRTGSTEPYRLHGQGGVVLGKLFAKGRSGPSRAVGAALDAAASATILRSGGRELVEQYWGRYVAIIKDGNVGTTWVLRDPTGSLPCLTTRLLGVDVFFSHMDEGALLGQRAFTVNWKYVAAALCQSRMQIQATGLKEVSQVLGGECVELREGRATRQFYWNLLKFIEAEPIEDPAEAAQLLRNQTRDCVHAWASAYPSIVHMLSGGLDSSIILACLKDAPSRPNVVCLNFYAPGSDSDERVYARLAAEGTGWEVIERPRHPTQTLDPLRHVQTACMPTDYFFYLDGGRNESELAAERRATGLFSGYGGDALFYQACASFAAGDYLRRYGIGTGLFTVALDAARMDRTSVWRVLREALLQAIFRRPWTQGAEVGQFRRLVRGEVIHDISRDTSLIHPWFAAPGRASYGKVFHAFQLVFPLEFYHPLGAETDPEHVTPLFSQPLLELAMQIPTWLLTQGGWDRAMARRAFQHDLPRRIAARRTKGGQEEHAKSILVRNMGFAREWLLDGGLVREGLLDPQRIEEVLSARPTRAGTNNVELFGCLSVEAWLRQWRAA